MEPRVSPDGRRGVPARRARVQTNSARSTLLTVISVFVYPMPKAVPTSAFLTVMELLGFTANATRQSLQRNAAAGWIEATRDGRRATWQLTPAGLQLLDEGSERIGRLSRDDRGWDGRVLFVTAEAPENDRAVRHTLRTRLAWMGFGAIAPGVWISTRVAGETAAGQLMARLDLPCQSYVARPGKLGDLRDIVARAWDLDSLQAEYQSFINEFRDANPSDGDEKVVALTRLVHRWRRFPFIDPGLPHELLPSDWKGSQAARLFSSLRTLWLPSALARWADIAEVPSEVSAAGQRG